MTQRTLDWEQGKKNIIKKRKNSRLLFQANKKKSNKSTPKIEDLQGS